MGSGSVAAQQTTSNSAVWNSSHFMMLVGSAAQKVKWEQQGLLGSAQWCRGPRLEDLKDAGTRWTETEVGKVLYSHVWCLGWNGSEAGLSYQLTRPLSTAASGHWHFSRVSGSMGSVSVNTASYTPASLLLYSVGWSHHKPAQTWGAERDRPHLSVCWRNSGPCFRTATETHLL